MQGKKTPGPRSIDGLIRSFLREHGISSTARNAAVFRAWSQALEPELRSRARAVRFRGGELTVELDSAAHLQELKNFTGETYRSRANVHLGNETIRKVVFKLKS